MNRLPSNRESENEVIKENILEIYTSVNKIYGFHRMTMNINSRMNKKYNSKRIYRLIKEELKISSVIRWKKIDMLKVPQNIKRKIF